MRRTKSAEDKQAPACPRLNPVRLYRSRDRVESGLVTGRGSRLAPAVLSRTHDVACLLFDDDLSFNMRSASDSCWSFSLCDGQYDMEMSDSESDQDDLASSNAKHRADASLLQELDIASRQDTANYKPNPWSIAKANAASRPRASPTHHPCETG